MLCCATSKDGLNKARLDAEIAAREWSHYQRQLATEEAEHQRMMDGMVQDNQCSSSIATTFYPLIGAFCAGLFFWAYFDYPLVPLQFEDARWGVRWLLVTIGAYYTCAMCFVGIILSSEGYCQGILWSLLVLLLGAPFGCAYLVMRVCQNGTLALMSLKDGLFMTPAHADTGAVTGYASGFYVVAGVSFLLRLLWTLVNYPLYPLQLDDATWACEWLFTTVGDAYTIIFCLCGVIVSSESTFTGLFWCFILLCLGGPGACGYMLYRAFLHQSITLQSKSTDWY